MAAVIGALLGMAITGFGIASQDSQAARDQWNLQIAAQAKAQPNDVAVNKLETKVEEIDAELNDVAGMGWVHRNEGEIRQRYTWGIDAVQAARNAQDTQYIDEITDNSSLPPDLSQAYQALGSGVMGSPSGGVLANNTPDNPNNLGLALQNIWSWIP